MEWKDKSSNACWPQSSRGRALKVQFEVHQSGLEANTGLCLGDPWGPPASEALYQSGIPTSPQRPSLLSFLGLSWTSQDNTVVKSSSIRAGTSTPILYIIFFFEHVSWILSRAFIKYNKQAFLTNRLSNSDKNLTCWDKGNTWSNIFTNFGFTSCTSLG